MKRVLSIILVAVMCFALMPAVLVSAAEESASGELVNLFTTVENGGVGVVNAAAHSNTNTYPNEHDSNTNYWCSEKFAVAQGDTIYFLGSNKIGYHVTLFDLEGKGYGDTDKKIKPAELNVVEKVGEADGITYNIYSYTPDANTGYIRVSHTNAIYKTGCVLLTKNQPFTAAEFKIWCAKNGGDYYALLGEKFVNLFTTVENGGAGVINAEGRHDLEAGYGKNTNYWCSEAISVTAGDTLYFVGDDNIGYHISTFSADGVGIGKVVPNGLTVFEEIGKNDDTNITYKIYSYVVPDGVGKVRISERAAAYETGCIVLTKNQPFGKELFKTWCEANNGDYNELLGIVEVDPSVTTGLNNLFTSVAKGGVGILNAEGHAGKTDGHGTNTSYWSTEPITVVAGDNIYFVGCSNIGHHVSTFDKNGTGIENIKPAALTVVEELGADADGIIHCIYSYTATENVGFVRISQKAATYNTKCVLVTKNQPFNKEKLVEWCTAAGASFLDLIKMDMPKFEVDTESPLYGKSALFIGDSITYGLGEERNSQIRLAWAGRLERMYNMTVVNAGDSGARISWTGSSGYIIDGLMKWTGTTPPDMVVMHGGVNDARYNGDVPIGELDSTDTNTFCGGLNKLFMMAKQKYPTSDLFYIANFFIPEGKGTVSSMDTYYALAKKICEKHGVTFIDLAGNKELNETLANKNASGTPDWSKYMPDKLHPNAAGYDVITPYIAEALENFYNPPKTPEDPENPDIPEEEKPDNTTATKAPATTAPAKKGCGGFNAASVAIVAAVTVFGAAITVIKKK